MIYPPDWIAQAIVIVPIAIAFAVLFYSAWRSYRKEDNDE